MTQLNNGIARENMDMSEAPFGNYLVRATYPENTYYKGSNKSCIIHNFPTSESDHDCWNATDFCEYDPTTCERGTPGENITMDGSQVVHDNQFLVANMKNSTSMELTGGVVEGQEEAMINTRIYLLHGSDLEIYVEQDNSDNCMHIHYTHPTNPAYFDIDIATEVDFSLVNKWIFVVDDGGCCSLRLFNQLPTNTGSGWETTVDYTYNFPAEFVLEPLDLYSSSTGILAGSRLLSEGINYAYHYVPHRLINCKDGTNWNTIGTISSKLPVSQAIYDNYGYVTHNSDQSSTTGIYSFSTIQLTTSKRIEVEMQMRSSNLISCQYGLKDISQSHDKSTTNIMGVWVGSDAKVIETHNYPEYESISSDLSNPITDKNIKVSFTITGNRYIVYTDDFGNRFVSSKEFSLEEIQNLRFMWLGLGSNNEHFSVTKFRVYDDYSAITPTQTP